MRFLSILVALAIAAPAVMSETTWTLDKAHSEVKFSVDHMVIAEVTGRFKDFDVTLTQPKAEDLTGSTIVADIKTKSIDTENEKRDQHLVSDDFLNAEKFPSITFKGTSVEKTGANTYKVTGDLTIRNVTKRVVLDAKFNGTIKDPWGNTRAGFKATTTIDRFDFDVKWNKAIETGGLVVGKDLTITLLMEFQKKG